MPVIRFLNYDDLTKGMEIVVHYERDGEDDMVDVIGDFVQIHKTSGRYYLQLRRGNMEYHSLRTDKVMTITSEKG